MNVEGNIARLPSTGARAASLAVLAFLFGAFSSLYAGFSKSERIDSSSLGKTLADNTVYVVSQDTTLERPSNSSESALYVKSGATAVIYIPKNVTLTVKGGNAQGTHGAGAGIDVPSSSTLIVTGGGKIVAQGGNAANGASGGNGGDGVIIDDNDSSMDEWGHAGAGGGGGNGGGGAAAGIGGAGGNGGAGGGGGGWTWYDTDENFDHNGSKGNDGGSGGGSSTGDIYILGSISASATGGSRASSGGSSGSAGSIRVEHWFMSLSYRACGGGGGGGGAGGGWAYDYGVGGYGGGGGGGGGGGATYQVAQGTDDDNSRGGYGGGGKGGVNGDGTQSDGVTHWGVTGGKGGYGGDAGSNASGGAVYRGYGVSLDGTARDYINYATTHSAIEYTLTMSDDWRTNEVHAVKLGYAMPSTAPVMSRENYTFLGWFDRKNGLGTKYYGADGACLVPTYAYVGDLTLYAGWQINDASAAVVTVNGTGIVAGVSTNGVGWAYDGTTGELLLQSETNYVISGMATNGEVRIAANCNGTIVFDCLALDTSKIGERIPFAVGYTWYPKIEVLGASRLVGGENAPGISLGDLTVLDIKGEASLLVKGGPGAADIGPNGSVSLAKVIVDPRGPDIHPARFKLASDSGWSCDFLSKRTGEQLERVWCVKVPGGFTQGAAVAWSGLSEDYSPKNTIGDEYGNAYLWLPDGMHVFSSLTASGEKDWIAWVEGAHMTAQPFASRGVTVNGTDIGHLKGDGWSFDNNYSLYLTNSGPFVLSGETVPGRDVVTVNVNADSSVTLSNLTLNVASGDYRAALQLLSGVSAEIFISGTNSLSGYVNHAAVSVPSGSTVTLLGDGYLRAEGGSGSPGIGSSRYAAFGTVNIAGGTIDAFGGSYAPGIGVGDGTTSGDFLGGRVVITGGTVYSKRDTTYLHNGQADIGKSDYGLCGQVIISGGSVKGYGTDGTVSTWKVKPAATNSLGAAVFPVTVPGLEANAGASMTWLTTAGASLGYGMDGVHADEEGNVYLWLPSNTYYFVVNGHGYRASVEGGAAVAEPWEPCVFVDGVDVCAGSGTGWTYMDRTVSFDDSGRTYLVTGTNTSDEVKFSAVDGVTLCLTNLSIAATNVLTASGAVKVKSLGPSRLVATGGKLFLGTGSVEILDGTLNLTGDASTSVIVSGGSVKYSGTAEIPFKNPAGDRVWCVTVRFLVRNTKVLNLAAWSEGSFPAYGSDGIYTDDGGYPYGQLYLWLPNGAYDFTFTMEESGEELEYVVFVHDANINARKYAPYGFFVDAKDVGHYIGAGWYMNDLDRCVILAETRDFVMNGSMTRAGVRAVTDATAILSNATVNVADEGRVSALSATANVHLDVILVGTNSLQSGIYSAGVYSSEGATVRLRGDGLLYAEGGNHAAGIGSGYHDLCGSVIIEGGKIKAKGGIYAPGIGVGNAWYTSFDLGGTFEISGGVVESAGSEVADGYPSDIGASDLANCSSITISGGTVSGFDGAVLSRIGKGRMGSTGSIKIVGGSVKTSASKIIPSAKDAGDGEVYPVTIGGFEPGAKVEDFAFQQEYGINDIYADSTGSVYIWLREGWNYFLVDGEPYRAKVHDGAGTAAQWMSGVYVDGIDAAYVTYGAWKLVDKFIDLTNAVSYMVSGETQEMSLRASANLTAVVSNLTVDVSGVSGAPAFVVSGVSASMVLKGTNAFSSSNGSAGVAVPSGATLTVSGEGAMRATGGEGGAGIGSGNGGGLGQLNITGGTITATGGEHAAGIGAGDAPSAGFDAGGTVRISGGRVTAVCGADAAPVGSSRNAHPGTVSIDGGTLHVDAQGGEGVIGSTPTSGEVGSVVIRGGAVYAATNTVLPVYRNHLSAQVFPLLLDIAEPESKVTGLALGLPAMSYYGDNLKDVYTDADGNLKIWLPSTGDNALTVSVTTESGETYRYCYRIDGDGTVMQVEFIAVNDAFVMSGAGDEGSGWNYRWDATKKTGVLSLTLDASVTGVATNGHFRIVVPPGGASRLTLNKLVLTAKNENSCPAMSLANDVDILLVRGSELKSTGSYSAGIEVATGASVSFSAMNENAALVAWGGKAGAGIGSSGLNYAVPGRIMVESGNITAYGGQDAAGIGGGLNGNLASGGIVMRGGLVRAHGGANAAGVGAGRAAVKIPDGAVRVEGGTLLAWGGDDPRQPGGIGGSQSQSDLILSLNNLYDVTGYTYKPFVVTGGSVMPEMTTIDKVEPRPADGNGTELYCVTFTNLVPGAAADIACDDIPDGFGLDDIFADDEGRVSIWLAPTNHARSIVVNGLSYKTEYPYGESDDQVLFKDVVAECLGPVVLSTPKSVIVMAMSVSPGSMSVVLPESLLAPPPETKKGAKLLLASPGSLNVRICRSRTLPFPDEPEVVPLQDCSVTPNGDGTVTVSIPLAGDETQMFYKFVE